MNRILPAVLAFLVLTITGCGSDGDVGDVGDVEGEPSDEEGPVGVSEQALSGNTCLAAVNDDAGPYGKVCERAGPPLSLTPLCVSFDTAKKDCAAGVFRVYRNRWVDTNYRSRPTYNMESMIPSSPTGSFVLAEKPQTGADTRPIYRCASSTRLQYDYTSRAWNCGVSGRTPISFHGYSFAANTPGAAPVYLCSILKPGGTDQFWSRSSTCEGAKNLGLLGYAK